MKISHLEKIGLKEKEAKVYIALLKKGEALANQLAKDTDILRSSIYDYLDILLEKGFASYVIKSGKKYFHAVAPEKILDNFEDQKRIEDVALREIVPELVKLQNINKKGVSVETFEGREAMKTALNRILRDNPKEVLVYGSSGAAHKLLPFFMEHFHNRRVKQKMHMKVMYNDTEQSKERVESGPSLKNSEVRFLPNYGTSVSGNLIYGDKVMIFLLNPETPLIIAIESEDVAKQYRDNFYVLWKASRKYQPK